jgi:excinuclease ABC subunit A
MKSEIIIKGASEHNLKNIDLVVPRNKLIVFTGVSGSGKSSLAFDTLYAEGQRRYVESLSAYARQFLDQMEKPKVDYIEGLSPAISIEQKAASKNPRSTVGTVTEIYDYLRVLFARIGIQHCYECGREVSSQTIDQMVQQIASLPEKSKLMILAPLVQNRKGEHKEELDKIRQEGFVRVIINDRLRDLEEDIQLDKKSKHNIDIVIDRLVIKEGIEGRLTDSLETALKLTEGFAKISNMSTNETILLSEKSSCSHCGISYTDLSPQHFSFNSPLGMCPTCHGLGTRLEFDPERIVPDKKLSIMEGAVAAWGKMEDKKKSWRMQHLKTLAEKFKFSLHTPWEELSSEVIELLLYGSKGKRIKTRWESKHGSGEYSSVYAGIIPTLERRMHETTSEAMRRYYLQFISDKPCHDCGGNKLRKEVQAVYIAKESINTISRKTIKDAHEFFTKLKLSGNREIIAIEVLKEIRERLSFLLNVGLHYLTLDRRSPTLSGGESQRIRLASQIGSGLVGVMYILDEPSIGLHHRDNSRLIEMLLQLRDLGNTVFVVEHDRDMMTSADMIYDFGPRAGIYGGEIIAQGNYQEIISNPESLTGKYLSGELEIAIPQKRIKPDKRVITIEGANQNNLKSIEVSIPIGLLTCVTGVSGSGKSSLINQILYPVLANRLNHSALREGSYASVKGHEHLDKVIAIDQQPIGRTPRSNPATYTKVFDPIRKLFASVPAAKIRGYKEGRFSFNVKGGRCEACEGAGLKQIEMHFLPDIFVTCEVCKGKRYNAETLNIKYKGKNIADVLDMDVQEAYNLFEKIPAIKQKLQTLLDVGLDYMKLGQASTTLSGGEAQRIKLSRELSKTSTGNTVYILDEPTTGLHFDDIRKLMKVLYRLVAMGNTVIVIEHNLDVIKCADYIIDLGPEGGNEGGYLVASGTPEEIIEIKESYTGQYLLGELKR